MAEAITLKFLSALSAEALQVLVDYSWPGNVRELRNLLERAVVLSDSDTIGLVHLPSDLVQRPSTCAERPGTAGEGSLPESVETYKVTLILSALQATGWRKKEAAARLGLTPRALSHYVQRYDLDRYRSCPVPEE